MKIPRWALLHRREFLIAGTAAVAWSAAACAQRQVPVIGYLGTGTAEGFPSGLAAFRRGLNESGLVEGQNVSIEFRWAEGRYEQLPALAADLVRRNVSVIVSTGGSQGALAAKKATSTIPIVFSSGADPVRSGLVASLNCPGGNITGVHILVSSLDPKKLGLLRELVPEGSLIGALMDPGVVDFQTRLDMVQGAASAIGQSIHVVQAITGVEIEAAFETFVQAKAKGLLVSTSPLFNTRRDQLIGLAARHALPAIFDEREFAVAGGLMSYGTSIAEAYRQVGLYAGRVLNGEAPATLPVAQSSKFEFVLNLRTAKLLHVNFPPGLLAIADEVIE